MITYDPGRRIYLEQELLVPDVRRTIPLERPVSGKQLSEALAFLTIVRLETPVKTNDGILDGDEEAASAAASPERHTPVIPYGDKLFLENYSVATRFICNIDGDTVSKIGLQRMYDSFNSSWVDLVIRTDKRLDNIGICASQEYDTVGIGTTSWGTESKGEWYSEDKVIERVEEAKSILERYLSQMTRKEFGPIVALDDVDEP